MAWLLAGAGLPAAAYRGAALRRRLTACLRHLRVTSASAARDVLARHPELLASTLNAALIGVTGFFRDEAVFDFLAVRALPELFARAGTVRVCSVGVSGGHELYSVAMLLAEAGLLERARLLGLDCRPEAIRQAEAGVFSETELAGISAGRRQRFFLEGRGHAEIAPWLRSRIRWKTADVFSLELEEPQALVLFRNVAIYFNDAHAAAAWTRLCARLAPGGIIVTGKAEKPPGGLPLERMAPAIYRRIPS